METDMELINKRKKRKTRRCLDALRKKIHPTNGVCKINKITDAKVHKYKSNNCITNNRLTLFNKAVRSETVTRVQLSELEGSKLKSNKDREIISDFHTNTVLQIEQNNNKIVLEPQDQAIAEEYSVITNSSQNLNNLRVDSEIDTPKSAILFSPESQNEEAINTSLESQLDTSMSSPSTINAHYKSKIFSDLMDSIEIYIKQNFPHLLNTDSIERKKEQLRKLCSEVRAKNTNSATSNSQIPSQNTLSNSLYSSPEVSIIQNPRDYLDCSWSQFSEPKSSGIHESSPNESSSSSSVSIYMPSTSPVVSTVYDTPEYSYYPHRLN